MDLQLEDLRKRMDEGKHLKLDVTTAAKDFIIDSSYDSVYGARPIKRFIQSRVETLIAKAIIRGSYAEGVSFALLFMNLWVPFINDWTRQTPYGYVKPAKKAKEGAGK